MNREQKKKLSRAKRIAQRDKLARIDKDIEEEEPEMDVLPEDTDEESEDEIKSMEKSYYGSGSAMSFSQLDAEVDAQEKMEKVNETSYMVQDMVRNIVSYPDFSPEEKSSAIKSVADEFSSRVRTIMESPMEKEITDDVDALVLEATLARDKRNMSFTEGISDFVTKAVLTAATENKLSDEKFALVRDEGGKKVRKYPIHDKAHVRNALARAAQMMKRGGEAAKDAHAAMPKIRAAAKRMGIDTSMEKNSNAIQIEKDAKGDWRAVMWVSNNFIDWDGDIICEDAHKEYVEWVNKEENKSCMPVFVTWHTPGTARENPVDYIDYFDGFLVASAKLTEPEAIGLLKASKETNIGMSHGSFAFARDPKDLRVITKYRMYEVSDLPLDKAANPFTAIETVSKEVEMDKKEYLVTLLGEEKAEAFLAKTGLKQKELKEAEIESKEADVVTPPVVETTPVEVTSIPEPVAKEENTEDVIAKVLKELDIEGLNAFVSKAQTAMEKVETLEALVKELSANQDDKLAEMITPPIGRKLAWSRPSESDENVAKDNDALVTEKPGLPKGYWLSELTGTSPIQEKV